MRGNRGPSDVGGAPAPRPVSFGALIRRRLAGAGVVTLLMALLLPIASAPSLACPSDDPRGAPPKFEVPPVEEIFEPPQVPDDEYEYDYGPESAAEPKRADSADADAPADAPAPDDAEVSAVEYVLLSEDECPRDRPSISFPVEQPQAPEEPEPNPDPEPEPPVDPEPEPEPQPSEEPPVEPTVPPLTPEPEPKPDPKPDPEPDPDPDPEPEPDPEPQPDPDPKQDPVNPPAEDGGPRAIGTPDSVVAAASTPTPEPTPADEPTTAPTDEPTAEPTYEAAPVEPTEEPTEASAAPPPPVSDDTGETGAARSSFTRSLPLPSLDLLNLELMGQNLLIAMAFILLLLCSAEIFNGTLQENYDEVMGIFAFLKLKRGGSGPTGTLQGSMPLDSLGKGGASGPNMPLDSLGKGGASSPNMPLDSLGNGAPQSMPLDSLGQGAAPTMPLESLGKGGAGTVPVDSLQGRSGLLGKLRVPTVRTLGLLAFITAGSAIGGLLDPGFGFNRTSFALIVGIGLGLAAITAVYFVAYRVYMWRRYGEKVRVQTIPAGLVVALLCVGLSRLMEFEPGYLYGIIAGIAVQREISAREEGGAVALTAIGILVISIAAWFAWLPVATAAEAPNPTFGVLVADAALASIFIAGVEILAFSLLPMRFLDGTKLKAYNRFLWILLMSVGMFMFVHVIMHPAAGFVATGSMALVLALLLGFLALSIAFWAYFRFRTPRSTLPAG